VGAETAGAARRYPERIHESRQGEQPTVSVPDNVDRANFGAWSDATRAAADRIGTESGLPRLVERT
jgi:hypothetical protein